MKQNGMQLEILHGDGESRALCTTYPLSCKPLIRVGEVYWLVGQKGIGEEADWYWEFNSNTIVRDSNKPPIGKGERIDVIYIGLCENDSPRGGLIDPKQLCRDFSETAILPHTVSPAIIEMIDERVEKKIKNMLTSFSRAGSIR